MGRLNLQFHLFMLLFILKLRESTFTLQIQKRTNGASAPLKQIMLISLLKRHSIHKSRYFNANQSHVFGILMMLAGDIETHPGPENIKRDVPELDALLHKKGVKIFHQNIRGLLSEFSQIEELLSDIPNILKSI